ncbi:MAG: SMP-30/gluconolactonase/LRE family protein [Acidobacteria bacterium]|nr:SMP-30/gluconolactonase/LRE family protein [Acidobacteriota bacterium]
MIFASGLTLPEGPVVLPDGSWLVVEGGARGSVTQISRDGQSKRMIARTGEPNGLAIDRQGTIWVAETRPPALIRLTMDGKFDIVLTACGNEAFLYPNDLCFGSDGALYLTDSGILGDDFAPGGIVRPDYATLRLNGRLYKVNTNSMSIEKLDDRLQFPNGIAFGPDGDLYINETLTGMVCRYGWKGGKLKGPKRDFGNVVNPQSPFPGLKGPDGMAFDRDGMLYVAVYGQGDVTVLDKDGAVIKRITTAGKLATNVAFGLLGQKKIYVTEYEQGVMEVFEVETDGLQLWA